MTPERGFAARWLRLFPFPLKIHFKGRQLPAGQEFSQIFFRFCNAGNEILATGGAENFSFHSLQHRILKFAKRGRQPFSGFTYLLRVSLRFCQMDNKKSSKSFSDLLLSLAAGGRLVFSFGAYRSKRNLNSAEISYCFTYSSTSALT